MSRRFCRALFDLCVTAPVRRSTLLRRMVTYLEHNSRPGAPGLIDLPGHRKYASLPGHSSEYSSRYYAAMRDLFINGLESGNADRACREEIVRRFERIDSETDIKSTPTEGLYLAAAALAVHCEGDFVECGCYAGGSTSKLSIVAKLLGRRLFVFDSFEGLPEPEVGEARDFHARRTSTISHDWGRGDYSASLDRVRQTITEYGQIDCCQFVKGWFADTLTDHAPRNVALAFCDVDLASSARECLRSLWPRMTLNAVFLTHDAAYVKVLQALTDPVLWRDELKDSPPIFWGAGFGMGDSAAHLSFAVKGACPPEYIKSLMLSK